MEVLHDCFHRKWRIFMVKKCLLKKFGILEVNKYVQYREHPNSNLVYVFFDNDWHTVEKDDVEIITQ